MSPWQDTDVGCLVAPDRSDGHGGGGGGSGK